MSKRINNAPKAQRGIILTLCIITALGMFLLAGFFAHLETASAILTKPVSTSAPTATPTPRTVVIFTSGNPFVTPTSSKNSATPTITPSASTGVVTPTPIPAVSSPDTQVYMADWSKGMDGWSGGTQWKTAQSMLLSDGSNCCGGPESIIVAPINLNNIPDYEVKARIQFIRANTLCSGYSFGIMLRMDNALNGYEGAGNLVNGACTLARSEATLRVDDYTELAHTSFVPDTKWHMYTVIVQGDQITFSIDGESVLTTIDNTHTTGGRVGIEDFNVQINISSFEVIAL